MAHLSILPVLIGAFAVVLAALALGGSWYNDEARRIRRGLGKVIRGEVHALLLDHGRDRGAGFNFADGVMAVAWDAGAWCLVYRIEELLGLELIVDGRVVRRSSPGEPRPRPEALGRARKRVELRLLFDDPKYADFVLELWGAGRGASPTAGQAIEAGVDWLARIEPVLRRRRPAPPAGPAVYRSALRARFTWTPPASRAPRCGVQIRPHAPIGPAPAMAGGERT
jgi:hypothetical protein